MAELDWNAEVLTQQLAALLPGIAVDVVAETGSTNTDLLEAVRAAAQEGIHVRRSVESRAYASASRGDATASAEAAFQPRLLVAERQTNGRGRNGRHWEAERSQSLTFSLAFALGPSAGAGLSLAVGVALAEALDPGEAPRLMLKWPNDLWLLDAAGGRKLGGVLIETAPLGTGRVAVVGVGLNVGPVDDSTGFSSGCAWVRELNAGATAPTLLARVAVPLAGALRDFHAAGFAPFRARYARRDLLCDRPVTTSHPEARHGTAAGIGAEGSLRVRRPDGAVIEVSSGEVSVRLRAGDSAAESPTA